LLLLLHSLSLEYCGGWLLPLPLQQQPCELQPYELQPGY
jgi:hypothetical protein